MSSSPYAKHQKDVIRDDHSVLTTTTCETMKKSNISEELFRLPSLENVLDLGYSQEEFELFREIIQALNANANANHRSDVIARSEQHSASSGQNCSSSLTNSVTGDGSTSSIAAAGGVSRADAIAIAGMACSPPMCKEHANANANDTAVAADISEDTRGKQQEEEGTRNEPL